MINRLPENILEKLKVSQQNLNYHPEGSVYNHVRQVYNNVQDFFDGDLDLSVTAIFHDLGKLDNIQYKELADGSIKISNINHESASLKYIENQSFRDLFSDLDVNWEKIYEITKHHMLMHLYMSGTLKKAQKRKKIEENKYFVDFIKFAFCDRFNPLKENNFTSFETILQNNQKFKIDISL